MLISICIPCYKSSKTLPFVVQEVKDEFARHEGYEYQFVLVNDGSPDGGATFEVIKELCAADSNIIGVNFSKNQGQASAKMAAAKYATGDALVYMDDDGQHPAAGVFKLIEKLNEGYDVVFGHFTNKQHSAFKKITSRGKKKLAEWMGTKPKGVDTSPFCAWSRLCMDAIKNYESPFPSANAYLRCVTDKFADVDVEHRARKEGKSGYTFKKLIGLWLNGFTNFSIEPLRFASKIGAVTALIGFLYGLLVIIRKIIYPPMPSGYASIIAILLFVGGIIMLILGLMGEYIGRMYMIMSHKPQYVVKEVVNAKEEE